MKYSVLILFFFLSSNLFAQCDLNENEIRMRCVEDAAQLSDYICFMSDNKKSHEVRRNYRKYALSKLMGNGNCYDEDGIKKNGAMVNVFFSDGRRLKSMLARNYFSLLLDGLTKEGEMAIPNYSSIQTKRINDSIYVCDCKYDIIQAGLKDGIEIYKDITTSHTTNYLMVRETENGISYSFLFTNINIYLKNN
jgi:hypothetical protein